MLRPQVGKRVRFNTWQRGASEYRGPDDRSKFTGEVVEIQKESYGTYYGIKRDVDGKIQFSEGTSLVEYVK